MPIAEGDQPGQSKPCKKKGGGKTEKALSPSNRDHVTGKKKRRGEGDSKLLGKKKKEWGSMPPSSREVFDKNVLKAIEKLNYRKKAGMKNTNEKVFDKRKERKRGRLGRVKATSITIDRRRALGGGENVKSERDLRKYEGITDSLRVLAMGKECRGKYTTWTGKSTQTAGREKRNS